LFLPPLLFLILHRNSFWNNFRNVLLFCHITVIFQEPYLGHGNM
jgi:hypothetical protein